jgi:hypothetical protein
MTTRRSLLAAVLAVALALPCAPAFAERNHGGSDNGGVSAEQAAAVVSRAYGGRVVSVKQEGNGYKVRVVLDGGRVKTVQVDSHGNISGSN